MATGSSLRVAFTSLTLQLAKGLESPENPYGMRKEFLEDAATFWTGFAFSAITGLMQLLWVTALFVGMIMSSFGPIPDSLYFIWASLLTTSVAIQIVSLDVMYGGNIIVLAMKKLLPHQLAVLVVWLPYLLDYVS